MMRRTGTQRHRAIVGAAASLALLGLVTACSGSSGGSSSSAGKSLTIVEPAEPATLEPCQDSLGPTGAVERQNILEGLTQRNPTTGAVTPSLATSWTQDSDTSWTFKIRSGVKFQNGAAMTADDVAFSINRTFDFPALNCQITSQFFGSIVPKATVTDASTVQITTNEADPILPIRLSFLGIVPKTTSTTALTNSPIGTGPYALVAWNHGVDITLKRFSGYWGAAPDAASVKYLFRSDPTVRGTMVKTNEADIAPDLDASAASSTGSVKYDTYQITFLRLDPTQAPMTDVRVRQAIASAIDVNGVIKAAFQNLGTPATQLIPAGTIGFDASVQATPFDLAKAKSLVQEAASAGVNVKAPITLIGREGFYTGVDPEVQVLQNELEAAGLNVKAQMLEASAWSTYSHNPFNRSKGGASILVSEHGNQGGDAALTLGEYYLPDATFSTGNDATSASLVKAGETATGTARQAAFEKVAQYVAQQVWTVPLAQMGSIIGLSSRVSYTPNVATDDGVVLSQVHLKS